MSDISDITYSLCLILAGLKFNYHGLANGICEKYNLNIRRAWMQNIQVKPLNASVKSKGYTMLELMISIALITLIAGLSSPIYSNFITNQLKSTALTAFHHTAITARSEAVTRLEYISVCPSFDGLFCLIDSNDYSTGWIMFVNSDKDYPVVRDDKELLLQSFSSKTTNFSLLANRKAFTFRPRHKRNTNGTLMFCPDRKSFNYQALIISYTGRPRIDKQPKSSHIAICDQK